MDYWANKRKKKKDHSNTLELDNVMISWYFTLHMNAGSVQNNR